MAGGGYLTLGLLPSFAIQPEILYSQKGYKLSGDIAGVPWVGEYRLNYVEIPVLAKFSFGVLVKPYILAGPYYATKISGLLERNAWATPPPRQHGLCRRSSDLGFVLGAGISTPVKLSLDVRYSNSFSTIFE